MLVSATLALVALALPATAGAAREYSLDAPRVVLRGTPFTVGVEVPEAGIAIPLNVRVDGRSFPVVADDDGGLVARVESASTGSVVLELTDTGASLASATTRLIPAWVSVVPPIIAIVAALVFRQVIPALFFGLFFGSVAVIGFGPTGIFVGLLEAFQVYVVEALVDPDHAAIILFSFMIGGMVGIITKNGGMQGVVDHMVKWATSPRRGQTTTALLGLAIFFDDYANTLVVGNTMRQVTDRLRISREKLAYIVDSTAAPVSCVALVTTWIGYEVGLIDAAIGQIAELDMAAYSVFLSSIPYSFYPLLTMFFVLAVANTGRDFGPMLAAETRARTTGQVMAENANVDERAADARELDPKTDKPHRAINAVLPIAVLIVGVLSGIYVTGEGDTLRDIVASTDSYTALLWASLLGAVTAAVLSGLQRILTLSETMDAWYAGARSMFYAMIILVLAWSLSSVSGVLHTADYLVSVLGDSLVPGLVPSIVFVLAGLTAFATGSSWGTMGILMPLVVPLVWAVLQTNGMAQPQHFHILYSTVSCVLAGAVLGDHCSPISDTTILSSMASGCDHVDHVRTQLPYALLVGVVAVLLGSLPAGFGVPWWIALLAGTGVLFAVLRFLGTEVEQPAQSVGSPL